MESFVLGVVVHWWTLIQVINILYFICIFRCQAYWGNYLRCYKYFMFYRVRIIYNYK
ncbi:hypothetical protein DDB_G0268466 [Dictyostelium discoideum AX4]|uniref:Uncharacterized protein n=1 Tax=Dictyostelium discoideum TaxID=44689 RepID=Q55F63_DICDI|nr:hypothetical protein DDB_G0268466 [Dictyostelium discoideum AX4]EAL73686.1 hypothetical protein DDB_G0268466 [Dictyostelium discoideum AX4]|eukprot:XP_647670.1 hypothetical protein DDB_G0268466 [Dictyostelium discoideum AX4]